MSADSDPSGWAAARRFVAIDALWAAVERGERGRSTGRVTVEASDLRLLLEESGDRAARGAT